MRHKLAALSIALMLIIMPGYSGEWFVQAYGGNGWTLNHNAHVHLPDAGITAVHKDLAFDSAPLIGIRGSYWFNVYLGFGLDASHFYGPDQKKQVSKTRLCVDGGCETSLELIKKFNNDVTSLGPYLLLRYPLCLLNHEIEPYAGIGPMLYVAKLKDTDNFLPPRQSSTSNSLGVKASAGLNLFFTRCLGAFIEYQFNSFRVKSTYHNEKVVHNITLGKTRSHEPFITQSLAAGLSFRI